MFSSESIYEEDLNLFYYKNHIRYIRISIHIYFQIINLINENIFVIDV